LAVSALTREAGHSFIASALLVLFPTGLLPALYLAVGNLLDFKLPVRPFFWASPGYAFRQGLDSFYQSAQGAHEFWGSLLTIFLLGLGCLLLASIVLPRSWQESKQAGPSGNGGNVWQRLCFGTVPRRRRLRTRLLDADPFFWLVIRDRFPQIAACVLVGLGIALCSLLFRGIFPTGVARRNEFFAVTMYATLGLVLSLKALVAVQATRRLCADRRSGALELMLVTPISKTWIVAGQRRALRQQFWLPVLALTCAFAVLLWLVLGPNPMGLPDDSTPIIILGDMVVLFGDVYALGWVGAWAGLRCRNHHRAILLSLSQVLLLPWLVLLVIAITGSSFHFSRQSETTVFISWYLFSLLNDAFWTIRARNRLRRNFRLYAADDIPGTRRARDRRARKPAFA
jgi:hypothetical protein